MRQWCLECILKFEGFAKTKGFLLCRDLHGIKDLLMLSEIGCMITNVTVRIWNKHVVVAKCERSLTIESTLVLKFYTCKQCLVSAVIIRLNFVGVGGGNVTGPPGALLFDRDQRLHLNNY